IRVKSINVKISFGLLRLPRLSNPFCPLRVVFFRGAFIFLDEKSPGSLLFGRAAGALCGSFPYFLFGR
ncbi:MAG: hypothetical protein Q4C37_11355, partial [Bacteroidales bacterium]|nr:hypothetical protein [Bacteroidales bacterium]